MNKNKLNEIDASLVYGQFFTGKWLVFFYSFMGFCCVMPLSTIVYLILVYSDIEHFNKGDLFVLVCSSLLSIAIIVGICYVLYRNNNLKNKINLWLNDAIELTAQTTALDSFRTCGHPVAETKLLVEFNYNDNRIACSSENKLKKDHWYRRNGYFKILSKYANRSIKIMYSPKYEQVMILKD